MKAGRTSDRSECSADSHGCPSCAHAVGGPLLDGSADVIINNLGAARVGDRGVHSSCCGPNVWMATQGAERVIINGRPAHRQGDLTQHCGGSGKLCSGSSNVLIGGPAGSGSATDQSSDELQSIHMKLVFWLTEEVLADEPYKLFDGDGALVRTGKTDSDGRVQEHDLKPGNYTLETENGWIIRV